MKEIQSCIHELMKKEGPEYPETHPWEVYQSLEKSGISLQDARLVLITMLAGAPEKARQLKADVLSQELQTSCRIQADAADQLASLYWSLYSPENAAKRSNQLYKGFQAFCKKTWSTTWEGTAVWYATSVHVDCSYEAEIEIAVEDKEKLRAALSQRLKSNPFLSPEQIWNYLSEDLCSTLDSDFEDFATADKYYEPHAEDYGAEYCTEEWCKEKGLKLVSFDGDGSSSDYEPNDDYRRW